MELNQHRNYGTYITAQDIADRLIPDLKIHEMLLWPPDLFAYTSSLLSTTSAYQLVVSPPKSKSWPPKDISSLLDFNEDIFNKKVVPVLQDFGAQMESDALDQKRSSFIESFDQLKKQLENKSGWLKAQLENKSGWSPLVDQVAENWSAKLKKLSVEEFNDIDFPRDNNKDTDEANKEKEVRGVRLTEIIFKYCPEFLLYHWALFIDWTSDNKFYNVNNLRSLPNKELDISDLLCNQDEIQIDIALKEKLWNVSICLLTLHAIADVASLEFGLTLKHENASDNAKAFAHKLLKSKGSLSTFNTSRCRILPKRHNPSIGITLRSLSSNLAFNQSSVDVVWRTAKENLLAKRLSRDNEFEKKGKAIYILLIPYPWTVNARDFEPLDKTEKVIEMSHGYSFFKYKPDHDELHLLSTIPAIIKSAKKELGENGEIDVVILPEAALSSEVFPILEDVLYNEFREKAPSILISGIRESAEFLDRKYPEGKEFIFDRNAVYCKYNTTQLGYKLPKLPPEEKKHNTEKYIQYKHHRWKLDKSQIIRYGLSHTLNPDHLWWEYTKIPKRRVSFLNVGELVTISCLICEDLARLDPISELIRQVGPSLVVAILMDGPQLKSRWSSRYATVLADDPGSSVITLTSYGMVRRHSSAFGGMSRVVGLWNEMGSGHSREIELAEGACGVLLATKIKGEKEVTADGRVEGKETSVMRLDDVIQIYLPNDKFIQ